MSTKITEVSPEILTKVRSGAISNARLEEYRGFLREVESEFMNHRIIIDNRYCRWFAKGEMTSVPASPLHSAVLSLLPFFSRGPAQEDD